MSKELRVCMSATGLTIATDCELEVIEYMGRLFRRPDPSNVDEILGWNELRMLTVRDQSVPAAPKLVTRSTGRQTRAFEEVRQNPDGTISAPRVVTAPPDQP